MAQKTATRAALTPRQQEMLSYIQWHLGRHGRPPTTQEAAKHFGTVFGPAYRLIEQLVRKQYVKKSAGVARGLKVLRNADGTAAK